MFSLPISTTAPPLLALKPSDTASAVTSAKLKLHYSILLHRPQQCFPNISEGQLQRDSQDFRGQGALKDQSCHRSTEQHPCENWGFVKKILQGGKKFCFLGNKYGGRQASETHSLTGGPEDSTCTYHSCSWPARLTRWETHTSHWVFLEKPGSFVAQIIRGFSEMLSTGQSFFLRAVCCWRVFSWRKI